MPRPILRGDGPRGPERTGTGRLVSAFKRDQRGVTAIEFSLLALPLFMTIFFVFECMVQYFVATSLDIAVQKATRQIRVGQTRQQDVDLASFKKAICSEMGDYFGCGSKLRLKIDVISNIAQTAAVSPIDASGQLNVSETFDTGRSGDFLLAQAFLPWPAFTGFVTLSSQKTSSNEYVLRSTTLFRNEPF